MKKPESISARDFVDGLPYIGETYQPDDRVYLKYDIDRYIEYLEDKRNLTSQSSGRDNACPNYHENAKTKVGLSAAIVVKNYPAADF